MSKLTKEQWNELSGKLNVGKLFVYKDKTYRVHEKSAEQFGYNFILEQIPDDGKKYILSMILYEKSLNFLEVGKMAQQINYSDITILENIGGRKKSRRNNRNKKSRKNRKSRKY